MWATAAACVVVMIWMGLGWNLIRSRNSYAGRKSDYYNSQVHGFISGHLYMDTEANPGLASPDPAVRARAPFKLDASYYKGRYYLYFGVTPAALVLLPYSWISGADLDSRFVVVLGAVAGFLFSVGILGMAVRDHFGRLGPWFGVVSVATLAFATAVPCLLARAMFYEIAIAAGYACTMAGAFWTYRAVSGGPRTCLNLALASLSFGLAVGCRPDLVLNVTVVAAAALIVACRRGEKTPSLRALLRLGAAAVLPAAMVGAILAFYNYERFGNPLEFGVSYSMNDFMRGDKPLFSPAYLWANLHWYYLTLPALSPYFPFVFPEQAYFGPPAFRGGETIHGQFPVLMLGALVLAAVVLMWKRLRLARLGAYLALLGWMFLALLLAVSAIGFRGDRYLVDCQPPLVLGTILLAGAIFSLPGNGTGARLWRACFVALALLAAAFNLCAGLQEFEAFRNLRSSTYASMESLANYPAYWLIRTGLLKEGPIELRVIFPANPKAAAIEPLLVAGTPEYTDSLYVLEPPSGTEIELIADHNGYGGPRSGNIGIVPGQVHTLTIDMGALHPPLSPPFMAHFEASKTRASKVMIHVELDGKEVLDKAMKSFDAPPWAIEIGRNDVTMSPYGTDFSGRILSATRLAPRARAETESNGLWRIACTFPPSQAQAGFPLLSAGIAGSGTLVYLSVLPDNRVRFGVDEWGLGGSLSDAVTAAPQPEHVVEILIGPLAGSAKWPRDWAVRQDDLLSIENDLVVWLDGRRVWTTRLRRAPGPPFDLGANRQGFTTAASEFPGPIRSRSYSPGEARQFLNLNFDKRP